MEEQKTEKELEISASGRNVSSQPDTITSKERLQICHRVKYQTRKLKNEGAILVLVWSFLVTSLTNYLLNKN